MGLNEKFFKSADEEAGGFFNTVIYTGNDANNRGITGVGFQPDLVWIKNRDAGYSHMIYDSVRGATGSDGDHLSSDTAGATGLISGLFDSFDDDGFTIDKDTSSRVNDSPDKYVAWCFKAGGAAVSNSNGSVTSQVSANVDNGFSAVKWSGNNGTSNVGHGLSSAPQIVIRKALNRSGAWAFDTSVIDGSWDYLFLNTTAASASHSAITAPTSTTFNTGGTEFNALSMIAYCFHSVAGVSKVGKYTGTGTSGNVIPTGFEPAFVIIKNTDDTGRWVMFDNVRDTDGVLNKLLYANLVNAEANASTASLTPNPTGFTIGNSNSIHLNRSGDDFIYYAVAVTP